MNRRTIQVLVLLAGAATAAALLAAGEAAPGTTPPTPVKAAPRLLHPVVIRPPAAPPRVYVTTNEAGQAITVSCGTCHATKKPDPASRQTADLDTFHQDLKINHGSLTCLSCHNRDNYDALRLASAESVAFPDVVQLCSQCHGPQWRDYRNGAHGGMAGYWDLTQGGRVRNGCTHCHDPHVPKYQPVHPAPHAADRFVNARKEKPTHE